MSNVRKIRIELPYDDWAMISDAVAEAARAGRSSLLMSLAAMIERSIGNIATAGCTEAEAGRLREAEGQ